MKLTTPLIVLGIVIALVAVYFSGVIPDFNDAVDDVGDDIIDPTPDPTDDYPDGWNVIGSTNYIVLQPAVGGLYHFHYYLQNYDWRTGYEQWNSQTGTLSELRGALALLRDNTLAGLPGMSQTQYDCGIAQITALGG